ncbi:MAG TPA: type II toxin-antitoxin system RelE/ParE family toxin [Crocinitomicaceae bacterium]|jgi:plasmid stabilization system protein ParE|nr:type II toxin-antitoxin system RelE/ParE family toxin [Crocinitomicaceae bacterium]
MAKRKIVWSRKAELKLFEILDFYKSRNGNSTYSKKLYKKFIKELLLLNAHPELGIPTEIEFVRGLIVDDFILFYEISSETIYVHTLWECRQNPDELKII